MKHKIYCFNNGGRPGWLEALAIGDTGHVVGQHICSHEGYMKHDLGIESTWKHDQYNKQYGENNWDLIWVDNPLEHEGCLAAFRLNKEQNPSIPDEVQAKVVIELSE